MEHQNNNSNELELIKEINKIKVTKPQLEGVIIVNPTDLPIVSCEKKRAVIGIDQTRCAVFFTTKDNAESEFQALKKGATLGITPKVYGQRGTYVIMEIINAPTLADNLAKKKITKNLTRKLLVLLDNFKKIGFTRLDHRPNNIYLLPDDSIKVVNVYRHYNPTVKTLPKRILRGMGKQVTAFLQYVKELRPSLYKKWVADPDFDPTIQKIKFGNRK